MPEAASVVKTAWQGCLAAVFSRPFVVVVVELVGIFATGSVESRGFGGQCGVRSTNEWPASEVIGSLYFDSGNRVERTWADQAPAAMTRWSQGTFSVMSVAVLRMWRAKMGDFAEEDVRRAMPVARAGRWS